MRQEVINATEARVRFGELLMRVKDGDQAVIIEKSGRPAAVMMSVSLFEALRNKAQPSAADPIEEALILGRRVRNRRMKELTPSEEVLRESREERDVF